MSHRQDVLDALRSRLEGAAGPRVSDIIEGLRAEDVAVLMRELPDNVVFDTWELLHAEAPELAVEVLPLLDRHDVSRVVDGMEDEHVADVLTELPSDDATYILELLSDDRVEPVVAAMEGPESEGVRERLEHAEGSAGRFMSTHFIALPVTATAAEAVRRVQEASDEVSVYYLYLVDAADKLAGVVSLRRLVRVRPERIIGELSPENVVRVHVTDDQEHVAQVVAQHDFIAVPVVDEDERLVGVITHDDVIDVLREEATEDMLKMSGTGSDDVISQSVWRSARMRAPWLFACLVGQTVGMAVLSNSQRQLGELFVAVALFSPAIVAMGGNVGTQAATIVVRGLATGRIRSHDSWPVFWREFRTAALMSVGFGVLLASLAYFVFERPPEFCGVVGAGLLCSMSLAAAFGTLVPIAFHAAKIDPAVATGPLVTTAMDVLGIGTYLTLASTFLLK